jgi:uncharacterized protein (TIGR02246 family)
MMSNSLWQRLRQPKIFHLFQLILGILAALFLLAEKPSLAGSAVLRSPAIANASPQNRAESMQAEEIRAIIEQSREAWLRGDAEAIASLFSREAEFIVPGDRWLGQEAIRRVAAGFFSTHDVVKIDIKRILIEGTRAAVEWYWEDREKVTGHLNKADDAIAIDFKDGKIVRWREYIDSKTWQ